MRKNSLKVGIHRIESKKATAYRKSLLLVSRYKKQRCKMAKHIWEFEPTGRWIRANFNDVTLANSRSAKLMIESRGELDYYFPVEDVQLDLLEESTYFETRDTQILACQSGRPISGKCGLDV